VRAGLAGIDARDAALLGPFAVGTEELRLRGVDPVVAILARFRGEALPRPSAAGRMSTCS